MKILDRIDATLYGLCPCGAQPREGSPYCSYDCEPNHIGEHTDLSAAGSHELATPMRWRPDLVTDAPDVGLTRLGGRVRSGRFWRQVFERDGTDRVHLRVDDGHRYVGADVSAEFGHDAYDEVWERLERNLTDPRQQVPDTRPTVLDRWYWSPDRPAPRPENPDTLWARHCPSCGRRGEPISHTFSDLCCWCSTELPGPPLQAAAESDPASGARSLRLSARLRGQRIAVGHILTEARLVASHDPAELVRSTWAELETQLLTAIGEQINAVFTEAATSLRSAFARIGQACSRLGEQLRQAGLVPPESPVDLRAAALEARRNRNTGPEQQQRAPRRIDPRRNR